MHSNDIVFEASLRKHYVSGPVRVTARHPNAGLSNESHSGKDPRRMARGIWPSINTESEGFQQVRRPDPRRDRQDRKVELNALRGVTLDEALASESEDDFRL